MDMREKLAQYLYVNGASEDYFRATHEDNKPILDPERGLADALIAALPNMVEDLVWEERKLHDVQAKFETMSACGLYKVIEWMDGSGQVLFFGELGDPIRVDAPTSAGGSGPLVKATNAHHRAQVMKAFGLGVTDEH